MFLRTLFWSFAALVPATASLAQQPNEGAYYCAAESSGGIVYNERTKKWEGTNFRPFSKFTLKFKYVRTTPNGDEYAVTITPDGKNDVLQCYPYRTQFPQFDEFGYLICRTDFFNYKFKRTRLLFGKLCSRLVSTIMMRWTSISTPKSFSNRKSSSD